jgi:hypothetical protein
MCYAGVAFAWYHHRHSNCSGRYVRKFHLLLGSRLQALHMLTDILLLAWHYRTISASAGGHCSAMHVAEQQRYKRDILNTASATDTRL